MVQSVETKVELGSALFSNADLALISICENDSSTPSVVDSVGLVGDENPVDPVAGPDNFECYSSTLIQDTTSSGLDSLAVAKENILPPPLVSDHLLGDIIHTPNDTLFDDNFERVCAILCPPPHPPHDSLPLPGPAIDRR